MFDTCVDDDDRSAFDLTDAEWAELELLTPPGLPNGPALPGPPLLGLAVDVATVEDPTLLLNLAVEAGRGAGRAQAVGLRALGRFAVLHPPELEKRGPGLDGGPLRDGGRCTGSRSRCRCRRGLRNSTAWPGAPSQGRSQCRSRGYGGRHERHL